MPTRKPNRRTLTNSDMSELYDKHSEELLRYLLGRVDDPQAAIDIVGETFARALKSRSKFRGESLDDARGWIFGIAKNVTLGYYKKGVVERKTMQKLEFDRVLVGEEPEPTVPEMTDAEVRSLIESTLGQIKPEYREAITMRYLNGREYPEIARDLNVTEEVIRARISRGLKQMRVIAGASDDWDRARSHG